MAIFHNCEATGQLSINIWAYDVFSSVCKSEVSSLIQKVLLWGARFHSNQVEAAPVSTKSQVEQIKQVESGVASVSLES